MRLGRVTIKSSYVVNLDDEDMVNHAADTVVEDIENAVKHNELDLWIKVESALDADESDIPSFLLEKENEDNV